MDERALIDELDALRQQVERATQQVNALTEALRAQGRTIAWQPDALEVRAEVTD